MASVSLLSRSICFVARYFVVFLSQQIDDDVTNNERRRWRYCTVKDSNVTVTTDTHEAARIYNFFLYNIRASLSSGGKTSREVAKRPGIETSKGAKHQGG